VSKMTNHPTGICPVCKGSTRIPAGDNKYKDIIAGYDKATDTFACDNCGGRTMSLRATGIVYLRADGTPCVHEYVSKTIGNCLNQYTCKHCPHTFTIDSSD
jgi:hypothetical protein